MIFSIIDRSPTSRRALLLSALLVLALPAQGDDRGEAITAGSEVCAACHQDQFLSYAGSVHSLLESDGWARAAEGDGPGFASCSACHGDPTAHLVAGGTTGTIFAFLPSDLASARSAACQQCHREEHPRFRGSDHSRAGIACTDCHTVHGREGHGQEGGAARARFLLAETSPLAPPFERTDVATASCASCHRDVLARFSLDERHPLRRGEMGCTDCHDPHDREPRARLGGFRQEACARCHSEQASPAVFEHGGQRLEGCSTCHEPHGTPNRHLLRFSQVSELCYSCHLLAPDFHLQFSPDTACNNCHADIHGSSLDTDFFR